MTIGADDSAEEVLRTMAKHQVRRLPVIDGHQLVGMVAQADVARALPDRKVGEVLGEISELTRTNKIAWRAVEVVGLAGQGQAASPCSTVNHGRARSINCGVRTLSIRTDSRDLRDGLRPCVAPFVMQLESTSVAATVFRWRSCNQSA